jgi:hypothetical protein
VVDKERAAALVGEDEGVAGLAGAGVCSSSSSSNSGGCESVSREQQHSAKKKRGRRVCGMDVPCPCSS